MSKPLELQPPPEPDADVIKICEKLLQYAKTGELRGVAYVAVWVGETADHGWALNGMAPVYRMVGELHAMSAHMLLRHDADVRNEVSVVALEGP